MLPTSREEYESKKVNIMPINGDKVLSYCHVLSIGGGGGCFKKILSSLPPT
jgi:hypothetical protein